MSTKEIRPIRDEIERRVAGLMEDLLPPPWLVGMARSGRSGDGPGPPDERPRSAVLVLIASGRPAGRTSRGDHGLRVLLTRRSQGMRTFPGAWTFPGGGAKPGDPDPTATALREAREETGLVPESVTIVGRLLPRAGGAYLLTPVLGWSSDPDFAAPPDPAEVSDLWWAAVGDLGALARSGARWMPDGSVGEIPPATRSILAELGAASRAGGTQAGGPASAT